MKKAIFSLLGIVFLTIGFISYANTNNGGKKKNKTSSPAKGTYVINTKDSVVTYRASDSTIIQAAQSNDLIPSGFKLDPKPR